MISALAKNIVFIIAIAYYLIGLSVYGILPQTDFDGFTGLECLLKGWLGFFYHINLFFAWTANLFWGSAVALYLWSTYRPAPARKVCWIGGGLTLCGLAISSLVYTVPTLTIMRSACCSSTFAIVPGPGAQLWIGSFVTLILAFAIQYRIKRVSVSDSI